MNPINIDNAMPQQLFQILTKAAIDSLNKGDILEGRVQSLDNGMLLIKLLDGSFFTAKVPDTFTASPNDLLALEIGDRTDGQITAKVVYISNGTDASNDAASIPNPNQSGQIHDSGIIADKSLLNAIFNKLSSLGVKPFDSLAENVAGLIKSNPELSLDEAAFIAANGLEPKPEIIKLIRDISEHDYKLSDNLQDLKNLLDVNLAKMDGEAREELLRPLAVSRAIETLSEKIGRILTENSSDTSIIENVRAILTRTLLNELSDIDENIGQKAIEELIKNLFDPSKGDITKAMPERLPRNPDKPVFDRLVKIVRDTLEEIHTATEKVKSGDEKEIGSILYKLFDKAYLDADSEHRQSIRNTAEAIKSIMEFAKEAVSRMDSKSMQEILPALKELDQVSRLFAQVTAYDCFMQIPLKINGEKTTGELYVMKRKGRTRVVNANDFTLLLSLNTMNLGCVEAFLNSRDKMVTISVRVEKDELVRLVKDNYKVLYDGLMKRGYKLADMKCRVIEEPRTGILNAGENAREYLEAKARVDLKI